ncbi:MAG: hypothetical protein AB8F74_09270 [Saprospiraceae bacterium]
MKNGIAICLSCLMLTLAVRDLITYVQFQINRDFIAKNFCINRDVKEINCHGTCFLNKTIKENKEKESKMPAPDNKEKTTTVYILSETPSSNLTTSLIAKSQFPSFVNGYQFLYHFDIFHPPQLV